MYEEEEYKWMDHLICAPKLSLLEYRKVNLAFKKLNELSKNDDSINLFLNVNKYN